MKRFLLFLAAALMVSTVLAGFKYEGEWRCGIVYDVDVGPNGNVYINAQEGEMDGDFDVRYYTPTGSLLGSWYDVNKGISTAPNGDVFTGGCWSGGGVNYYTPTGSLKRFWNTPGRIVGGDVAPDGTVYVKVWLGDMYHYTSTGSLLGSWPCEGGYTAISKDYIVYVVGGPGIQYFTSTGSILGSWLVPNPFCVAVAPNGEVFVTADSPNGYVRRYTSSGSLIEMWGTSGSGPGEFESARGIAVSPDGKRVYVADEVTRRVQYFNRNLPTVAPTSLGKLKALFK